MDPDVQEVLTSFTEKQLSCSPTHARHVFSGDWVWSFTASIVFALAYVHRVFSAGWILVLHCFCPLVHTISTTANISFLRTLAPLLLMTTHCFHRKALWPGHKAPQDLTHCNFPFTPLLTCCPVQCRSQHPSSPNRHRWIFHTCLYLPLYL